MNAYLDRLNPTAREAVESLKPVFALFPIVLYCLVQSKIYRQTLSESFKEYIYNSPEKDCIVDTLIQISMVCPFIGLNIAEFVPVTYLNYLVSKANIVLPPLCQINPLKNEYYELIDEAMKIRERQNRAILLG